MELEVRVVGKLLAGLVFVGCVLATVTFGNLSTIGGGGLTLRGFLTLAAQAWAFLGLIAIGCAYLVLGKGSGVFCILWLFASLIAGGVAFSGVS
jgi:hypothetical protein